jgi:hypothetical protein
MKNDVKKRCKATDCRKWFDPQVKTQQYCSKTCKNRMGQVKLRARAKIGAAVMRDAQQ